MTDNDGGHEGRSRRDLLKKAAIAGAATWIAPTVVSVTGAAAASAPNPTYCISSFFDIFTDVEIPTGEPFVDCPPAIIPLWSPIGTIRATQSSTFVTNPLPGSAPSIVLDLDAGGPLCGIERTVALGTCATYTVDVRVLGNHQVAGDDNVRVEVLDGATSLLDVNVTDLDYLADQSVGGSFATAAASVTVRITSVPNGDGAGPLLCSVSLTGV